MKSCWIITEGIAGTENQCLGVAESLGLAPDIKRIGLRQPWKTLSPYLPFECAYTFTGDPLTAPWPDLVIASGRKAIAAARYIKKQSGDKTFTVQIQDPRINPKHFDLVAVPAHDPTRGDNVIVTHAAPNRITMQKLDGARAAHLQPFDSFTKPIISVLIGGNSKAYKMPAAVMEKLAQDLKALTDNYSLAITTSRRTGDENQKILEDALKNTDAWIWDGSGLNPYFAMLAWADFIFVTADSVSMISEAATTGKPVYMIPLEGGTKRFDKFHKHLVSEGIIRIFDGTIEPYKYEALDCAARVAREIMEKLNK
jgi:mitochondrial fission protein ELM1